VYVGLAWFVVFNVTFELCKSLTNFIQIFKDGLIKYMHKRRRIMVKAV